MLTLFDLEGSDLRGMTEHEQKDMARVLFAFGEFDQEPLKEVTEEMVALMLQTQIESLPFALRVMLKRLARTTPTLDNMVTIPALLWATALCEGSPGKAVMWAYAIYCDVNRRRREGQGPLTLQAMALDPFGDGVPTEDAMHRLWVSQKVEGVPGGNLLDLREPWVADDIYA